MVLALMALPAHAAEWEMKQGPMMTPWSETLNTDNVLP